MVYVYSKLSQINKYVGKELTYEEIEETLKDLGMDLKGVSEDKDPELKIEITAEKMDMVSTVGVARAIRHYRGISKSLPVFDVSPAKTKLIVEKSVEGIRPKTVAAILRDVPMSEEFLDEMIEIQEKMHESFARGRKKAAIGIYPMDEIEFPITYKAEKGEDIVYRPLESETEMNANEILEKHDTGKKYAHLLNGFNMYPVFRDAKGDVLSMPPIINSHKTGRVEPHHKNLFIECSGSNMNLLDNVLKVLVTTFMEMGAKAEKISVEYHDGFVYEIDLENREDEITLDFINKLIGIDIKKDQIKDYLNKVQYDVKNIEGNKITVLIPPYRSDVWHDVDIADDVARGYGYNNITPKFPNISSIGETLPISDFREKFTQILIQSGFLELYTYILASTKTQFDKMCLDEKNYEYIRINDSAEQGINMCRIMILPENLESLHINRKNTYPQKIFENGFTLQADNSVDTKARNESHLSISIADPKSNYTQIKSILDMIMNLMEIEFSLERSEYEFLIKGRQAKIFVKGEDVGFIGEIYPQVLDNFGILVPVSSIELNLQKIFELLN